MSTIAELCLSVRDEYMGKRTELPIQKQFHFLSRLYLWTKKPRYLELLREIREKWERPFERIETRVLHIEEESAEPKRKARKEYREEANRRYHLIRLYNRYFFRCLFSNTLFQHDVPLRVDVAHLIPLWETLVKDRENVFSLSTPAVNFISLTEHFLKYKIPNVPPEYFLAIGDSVRLEEQKDDNDARIYFYTHAIINGSGFYTKEISQKALPYYVEMIKRVESIIERDYDSLSLDHKCEFLVCAALCSYESLLKKRIALELERSHAKSGTYFVNRHNTYAQAEGERSFRSMEHTNVLALMAFLNTAEL